MNIYKIKDKIKYIYIKMLKKLLFILFNILFGIRNVLLRKEIYFDQLKIYILILKPLGIGDLIMLSPFIQLIAEQYKKNKVILLTDYEKFINFKNLEWKKRNNKDVDLTQSLVISPTLAYSHLKYMFKATYYIGYFYSSKLASNFLRSNYKYEPKGFHYLNRTFPILDNFSINYGINNFDYPLLSQQDTELQLPKQYICIAPYSNWLERQYPLMKYITIIEKLIENKKPIILVGASSKTEIEFNKKLQDGINNKLLINLTGKTNLRELIKVIKNSICFIGNDSGPAHISYVLNVKSFIFWGSVPYENRVPLSNKFKKIVSFDNRKDCPIFPCYDGFNKPLCKIGCVCIRNIREENVISQIEKL